MGDGIVNINIYYAGRRIMAREGPWAREACFTTVSLSTAESSCINFD